MPGLYTRFYADARRSGHIPAAGAGGARLLWGKRIAATQEDRAEARLLISTGDMILVDGMKEIHAFDADGVRRWGRPKWPGTQVAFEGSLAYHTSAERNDRMEGVDLKNNVLLQDFAVPGIFEGAWLVLFEPTPDGLVAQAQDPGSPHGSPRGFMLYKVKRGGLGFEWSCEFPAEESPVVPLVCHEKQKVVTTVHDEAVVFDLDPPSREPAPAARFPLPLAEGTMWVSCGADGVLYWAGRGPTGLEIRATDMLGEEAWAWTSAGLSDPIAPPMVTGSKVFALTLTGLVALEAGRPVWSYEPVDSGFRQATSLGDGSVLVVARAGLHKVGADGRGLVLTQAPEALVTPPVIDAKGRIYAASREALYAFE